MYYSDYTLSKLFYETQILTSALRLSRVENDIDGAMLSYKELARLYPDLTPNTKDAEKEPKDYYQVVAVDPDSNRGRVRERYHRKIRTFLNENADFDREDFLDILNAGIILSSQRLRLSHDLHMTGHWIKRRSAGQFSKLNRARRSAKIGDDQALLIDLLLDTEVIEKKEAAALRSQLSIFTGCTIQELILFSGYLSRRDLGFFERGVLHIKEELTTREQFCKSYKAKLQIEAQSQAL